LVRADYAAALSRLAQLKEPVDNFFDNVMVNCEDLQLRMNRLALLDLLAQQFLQIADISKLQS
jgi:glycyl-tRNA synthetase beta chain